MFSTNQLRVIPKNLIQTWLKEKDLSFSGNIIDRVDGHLGDNKFSTSDLESLLDEYKDNGRKHVYLFSLSDEEWATFPNADALKAKFDEFLTTENSNIVFNMNLEKNNADGDVYTLRLVKTIQVPKIDKETKITHNGREWAAIIYVDVPVHVIFKFNTAKKILNLKFDSVKEMGHEQDRIYSTCLEFFTKALGLETVNSVGLSRLASQLEGNAQSSVFNLIGKYEAEDGEGNTITGTVHLTRDDGQGGSASALPGGEEVLSSENSDVFLDTYDVLWLKEHSNGKLTRNVRTTIKSITGNISFRHHVFKEEMEYVLSCIRNAASGQ